MFNELVLTEIPSLVEYLSEEVSVLAEVHDDVCEILVFNDPME
jgi:hypothetical protein